MAKSSFYEGAQLTPVAPPAPAPAPPGSGNDAAPSSFFKGSQPYAALTDLDTAAAEAIAAATAAAASETAAAANATSADASEAAAATSAAAAAASAAAALTSENNAETAETNAETAETNAETAEANAAASAAAAAASATAAQTAETNAELAETNAETAETNAETSATNAAASAVAAAASATAAQTAETNAETAETNAETAETNAETAASDAAFSASNAASSASSASTAASNASTSASNAATSATNAANAATAADASADAAALSETNAASSATAAAVSYDSFDDRYLGAKASPPTLDNDGNTLLVGALYWDTGDDELKAWSGSAWFTVSVTPPSLPDGDKGDITVSSSGTVWTVDNDAITYEKIQDVSATDKLLGRSTAGAGNVEEIACTAAGRALLDDATTGDQRTTLGLAAVAASGSASDLSTGTLPAGRMPALTGDVTASAGSAALTLGTGHKTRSITFVIDGGGVAITAGLKGYLEVPFACTITQWTLLADPSGSIVIDIWKDTYANAPPISGDVITASAKPTVSGSTKGQSSTLTGWTTSIAAGDILAFNVNSVTTCTKATISLKVTVT